MNSRIHRAVGGLGRRNPRAHAFQFSVLRLQCFQPSDSLPASIKFELFCPTETCVSSALAGWLRVSSARARSSEAGTSVSLALASFHAGVGWRGCKGPSGRGELSFHKLPERFPSQRLFSVHTRGPTKKGLWSGKQVYLRVTRAQAS